MFLPKTLIVIFLVIFQIKSQFYYEKNGLGTCGGANLVEVHNILKLDVCRKENDDETSYSMTKCSDNTAIKVSGCEQNCQNCSRRGTFYLRCHQEGQIFNEQRCGNIPSLKEKGFYLRREKGKCPSKNSSFSMFETEICQPYVLERISVKYFYSNNVGHAITYNGYKCEGDIVKERVFPIDKCVKIDEYFYYASRLLE